jgi:tetratricopeptide (TPR) repeat protein
MNTHADRWPLVRAEFDRLAALGGAERATALRDMADRSLAQELASLLEHHDRPTLGLLSAPALADTAAPGPEPTDDRSGQRLGAWRISARLGAGGMGEVWLARRDDGAFQGEAAVKVLKRGMDSAAVLGRFAQERQALAQLAHPHIARLLDAGRTDDGLPYFVMERVAGEPIDRACAGLDLAARLRLFLQLADAVSHAHKRMLVHRDLKPANVLVDGDGRVKLLDFGIAKALDPLDGPLDAQTMGGQRPFTPSHASPEQVRGEEVTPASDIYSLGVVLHQMLTGTLPTGRRAAQPAQQARAVLEETPLRPSRLPVPEVPEPMWRTLRARVAGDLDNILLKALEKAPLQRYANVDAMAADVQAFLDGRAVSARSASRTERLLRWARRHRGVLLAAVLGVLGLFSGLVAAIAQGQVAVAVGVLGLAAGLGLALVQARRAAQARDAAQSRFDELRQLAHHVLFDYHDLVEPLVGSTPVRQRLVKDALTYLDRLAQAAPRDRGLRLELGTAYRAIGFVQRNGALRPHLGDRAGAMRSYAQSQAWLEPLLAEDPRDDQAAFALAQTLSARAGVEGEDGDRAAARTLLRRAATLFEPHLDPDRPDLRHRLELARTQLRLATHAIALLDLDDANACLDLARAHLSEMARRQPQHPELDHVWVWVWAVTKRLRRAQGRWTDVLQACDAAGELLARLHAAQPDNARFLEDLAGLAHWRARAAGALGDVAGVQTWGRQASEQWGALAARDPGNALARHGHLDSRISWGREAVLAGDAATGLRRLQEAVPVVEETCRRWPDDVRAQARRIYLADAMAQAHHALGDTAAAQAASDAALRAADALCAAHGQHAAALTAQVVARLTPALWRADAAGGSADAAALQPLRDVHAQAQDLARRARLEDHGYAWRLQALRTRLGDEAFTPRR